MDQRARRHMHALPEEDIWLNHNVSFDQRIMREEHGFRRNQRHTGKHHFLTLAVLPDVFSFGEFSAIVDADHIIDRHFNRYDIQPLAMSKADNVGEIIFALGVLVINRIEKSKCVASTNGHKSAIAKANFLLRFARFFFLDDCGELATFFDQATIAMRARGAETDNDNISTL